MPISPTQMKSLMCKFKDQIKKVDIKNQFKSEIRKSKSTSSCNNLLSAKDRKLQSASANDRKSKAIETNYKPFYINKYFSI